MGVGLDGRPGLHLIKLCVGAESVAELAAWQARRLAEKGELVHVTRATPRRGAEIMPDGSLYWVIKGVVAARQRLLECRAMEVDGVAHCGLVLDAGLVAVRPRAHRPFQGWRYLKGEDAPEDWDGASGAELPPELRRELALLGLV